MYYTSTQLSVRNLCKKPNFAQIPRQAQILILKILNVFLPALWNAKHIPLGWLIRQSSVADRLPPGLGTFSLNLGKLEPFETGSLENIFFLIQH